jgi:hypothetical protein
MRVIRMAASSVRLQSEPWRMWTVRMGRIAGLRFLEKSVAAYQTRALVSTVLVLSAVLLVAPVSAFAQGTDAQRDACTPDAFRLCAQYMPDADRITACLRNSGSRLSRPCYNVFFPPQPSAQREQRDPYRRDPYRDQRQRDYDDE